MLYSYLQKDTCLLDGGGTLQRLYPNHTPLLVEKDCHYNGRRVFHGYLGNYGRVCNRPSKRSNILLCEDLMGLCITLYHSLCITNRSEKSKLKLLHSDLIQFVSKPIFILLFGIIRDNNYYLCIENGISPRKVDLKRKWVER